MRALLAGLPKRVVSPAKVCELVDSPSFQAPTTVVQWDDANITLTDDPEHTWTGRQLVPRCHGPNPYGGTEKLTPLVTCERDAARCTFYLVSGGKNGTPLPPSERTYWFDTTGGKLVMVAAALPHMQ